MNEMKIRQAVSTVYRIFVFFSNTSAGSSVILLREAMEQKAGNGMNTETMYENLKSDLVRFARSISRHEQEADDLVQDALEKSLKQEELVDLPIYKQRAWFFRVMKNRLIDDRRKDQRISEWDEETDFPEPALAVNRLEMTELLAHLTPELGDLVFKRYWLGMTSREIGEQLQVPAATIRYKLHFAIKKLRDIMEEEF
ncbi:RNA polymerase sigma factor [Planococcus sp. X10-3]|uniref:RNA polymerase sigma factor n=1 Tax=Planococcus sp. X10-3 TaxID=3061240 RepID=UPI003BAEE82C